MCAAKVLFRFCKITGGYSIEHSTVYFKNMSCELNRVYYFYDKAIINGTVAWRASTYGFRLLFHSSGRNQNEKKAGKLSVFAQLMGELRDNPNND